MFKTYIIILTENVIDGYVIIINHKINWIQKKIMRTSQNSEWHSGITASLEHTSMPVLSGGGRRIPLPCWIPDKSRNVFRERSFLTNKNSEEIECDREDTDFFVCLFV